MPTKSRTYNMVYYLRIFIRVRWIAMLVATTVIASCQLLTDLDFPYYCLYAVVAAVLGYNFLFHLCVFKTDPNKRDSQIGEPVLNRHRSGALLQIGADLIALFWMIHFSGGLENPFIIFFLFHVVIAGLLLTQFQAAMAALLVGMLVFSLGVIEKTQILDHHHVHLIYADYEIASNWVFVLGFSSAITVAAFVLSAFSIIITNERERRRSELIKISSTLEKQNAKLLRLDEMRRGLLAVASHDLKSPLAAVASYLMTLENGYLGEMNDRQLAIIKKCLIRLEGLGFFISDVLSWSTIARGELQQNMKPMDLGAVLTLVTENHQDPASQKGLTLNVELGQSLPQINASAERLAQVFENLMSNAIKYTEEGHVTVTTKVNNSHLLVSIKDTGLGVSEEDQKHLFEDFFRADSVKKEIEGTGLGLSVVKRIVEGHQGEIWAESELGVGTTMFVKLPIEGPSKITKPTSVFPTVDWE